MSDTGSKDPKKIIASLFDEFDNLNKKDENTIVENINKKDNKPVVQIVNLGGFTLNKENKDNQGERAINRLLREASEYESSKFTDYDYNMEFLEGKAKTKNENYMPAGSVITTLT